MLFQELREFTTGLLNQLLVNLAGQDGQSWLDEFKKFLRHEPCWTVAKAVVEELKEAKIYLRRLFTFKLGVTDGAGNYETAKKVFKAGFDADFKNWGIVFSGVSPETEIAGDELILNGKFSDFLGNTATELEKRRLLGSQFLKICRENPDKLRDGGYANFFVLTKGDEAVAEDLSNVFVADVNVSDRGELDADLDRFRHDFIWYGDNGHRVFSPQQKL